MFVAGKYGYPFVECSTHAGPQQAYVTCPHVMDGQQVAAYKTPTDKTLGIALCADCNKVVQTSSLEFLEVLVICKPCALKTFGRALAV